MAHSIELHTGSPFSICVQYITRKLLFHFRVFYWTQTKLWSQKKKQERPGREANVWEWPSGVFVIAGTDSQFLIPSASDIDAQGPPSVCLYTFYCGPLQCTTVESHDSHMTLPLPQQYSRVVEILDCSVPNYQQIAVVSGSCWDYSQRSPLSPQTLPPTPPPPAHTHTHMQVQESGDFAVFDFNGDNGCWSFKSQGLVSYYLVPLQ